MIRTSDSTQLWSEHYDRELGDVFEIQEDIARAIVDRVRTKLLDPHPGPVVARHTQNPDVYRLYLEARYCVNQQTESRIQQAIGFLDRALEMQPQGPVREHTRVVEFQRPLHCFPRLDHRLVHRQEAVGAAERQTILTGFLVGGSVADLAVVHIDENDDRRLRIFTFTDGDWAPEVDTTLRPEASFVDVANIDGRDRLIAYGDGRLTWFDPETGTERELAAVISDFSPPPRGEVLHVDITRDLNGDGRDDLVVPHGHGFQVLVQMSGGAFAEPVAVGPSTGLDRVYGTDGYRYRPWEEGGRVHEMDYDLDGRIDLVFWNDDHFVVHLQDERGLFAAEAGTTFTTEVAFDSDQIASLAAPQEVRRRRIDDSLTGSATGRVLHSLTGPDRRRRCRPRGLLAGDQEHVARALHVRGPPGRAHT